MQNRYGVILGMTLVALMLTVTVTVRAAEPGTRNVVVPAQPIAAAINELSRQSGLHIVIDSHTARGVVSNKVEGALTAEAALAKLLENTGLRYEYLGENAVAIVKKEQPTAAAGGKDVRLTRADASSEVSTPATSGQTLEEKQNDPDPAEGSQGEKVGEIIVTAQKREERLQDVPVPVTAINASSLVNSGQFRLQDYYTRIPGLNFVNGTRGDAQISIRGVSTGFSANPTVGVTIDDVPFGASTLNGSGNQTPDLDPGDLQRVEVLRGPQGTLYGANSIGGLIKFVTIDPSAEAMSGRVQAGVNSIHNGDQRGYGLRGSLSAPLSDTVAVRMSGFTRRDPGYIDNLADGTEGVNEMDASGGRLSAIWRPSENFSLKMSGLIQDIEMQGSPFVNIGSTFGDLQQSVLFKTGWYEKRYEAYSAIVQANLGSVELTSISGYGMDRKQTATTSAIPTGVANQALFIDFMLDKLTQEVRLSGAFSKRFDWLVGGFYTDEKNKALNHLQSVQSATGAPISTLIFVEFPNDFEEKALFADLTYHFSDRFDVQVGGRASENKQKYFRIATGPNTASAYGVPSPAILPQSTTKDSPFTYLITPRFKISSDLMLYGRFASGYRPGSINSVPGVPVSYDADTTLNYEVGIKGSLLDRTLSYDASLYHIDWQDIQIRVLPPGGAISYTDNAGEAKSQGVEFSVELRPLNGLTIAAWGAYNIAELTEDFPFTAPSLPFGRAGTRLPFSARESGNLSIDYQLSLSNALSAVVAGSLSYTGERQGDFVVSSARRQKYPSYTQLDLRAGVEYNSWEAILYVNNISDKRAALTGDPSIIPTRIVYIQPRTVGLSLSRTW